MDADRKPGALYSCEAQDSAREAVAGLAPYLRSSESICGFNSQFLTPARLMWVLDIGESTEAAWRAEKRISFFRQGRVVRYDPAAVWDFIRRYTLHTRPATVIHPSNSDWLRIERLIADQVEQRLTTNGHNWTRIS